jgi:hypothetical protein
MICALNSGICAQGSDNVFKDVNVLSIVAYVLKGVIMCWEKDVNVLSIVAYVLKGVIMCWEKDVICAQGLV